MKKILLVVLMSLFCQIMFSQGNNPIVFKGRVVNDSIKLKNIVIFNINSQLGTTINSDGLFELPAKVNDTLFFTGMSFFPKRIVLTEKQVKEEGLIVNLETYVNSLDEVVVHKKGLNLKLINTKNIQDKQYVDDRQSTPRNNYVYDGSIVYGIDFIRLYKNVAELVKSDKKSNAHPQLKLSDIIKDKVSFDFFKKTLLLKDEEIGLFFSYCERDFGELLKMASMSSFETMEFLISKNKGFQNLKNQ